MHGKVFTLMAFESGRHESGDSTEERRMTIDKDLPPFPQQVALDEFDARMRANLNGDDCWSNERTGHGRS